VEETKPDWLAFFLLLLSSRREGALAEPLALLMATALFSLLADKAFLSSRSRAGNCLAAEIAFKKARSCCFSISCKQENVLVRINILTGGEHSLSGRKSLRTLAYNLCILVALCIQKNVLSLQLAWTYRLKRTGEISLPFATLGRMPRREEVAAWKNASNVRLCR
jgi:hypothetical protein